MSDDQTTVASDEELDDGTAAEEAAQEEAERQVAAAAEMDPDGPTSDQLDETPEDEGVAGWTSPDSGGSGTGEADSGMSEEQAAAYEESNFGVLDEETMEVLTPDELAETLGDPADKIAELGGSVGTSDPSLGGETGYGPSGQSQPSVADGARDIDWSQSPSQLSPVSGEWTNQTYVDSNGDTAMIHRTYHDTGNTSQTWYGDDGDPVQHNTTSSHDNDQGGTTTTQHSTDANGTTTETTKTDADGKTTEETTTWVSPTGDVGYLTSTTTDEDDNTTKENAWMNGDTTVSTSTTTDSDGNTTSSTTSTSKNNDDGTTTTTTTTTDENGTTSTNTTADPGPFGADPVPGGLASSHVEELQEQGPQDTGSGDVDPSDEPTGEGSGDPMWDETPGVDDPPDEADSSGGPVDERPDGSGWDVDPVDDDDFGGGVGPDDGGMQLPGQEPSLDASDVVPDGNGGSGRPTVEAEEQYVVVADSGMPQRTDGSDGGDFGSGAGFEAVASTDVFNRQAGVKGAAGSTEPPGEAAADAGVGDYEQAMAVEVTAHVAVPAEPDAVGSRAIETDLDDAEIEIIANTLADDASTGRGGEDPDPFD